MSRRPLPRTHAVAERPVPAAALRALLGALALVAVALLTTGGGPLLGGALVVALLVWRPQPAVVALFGALLSVAVLATGTGSVDARVHVLVLLLPAVVRLASLVGHVPWGAVVELAVLGAAARRLVAVQVVAQPLAAAAGLLPATPAPWLGVAGVLAVGAVGWLSLRAPR